MKYALVGLFYDVQAVKNVSARLEEEGIETDDVACVSKGDRVDPFVDFPLRTSNSLRQGSLAGTICGLMGALAAAVVAGPAGLVGAGAFAVSMFAGSAGGALGFLGGALSGSNTPKAEVQAALRRVENGETLLVVHVEGFEDAAAARKVFEERGDVLYEGLS